MRYLTIQEVLFIHYRVVGQFGGIHGVRDLGALDSAVFRPQTSVFGYESYPTLTRKATVLLHSLVMNHPFSDGNKRTALGSLGVFLKMNGMRLAGEHQDIEDFVVRVPEEHLNLEDIEQWLNNHTEASVGK